MSTRIISPRRTKRKQPTPPKADLICPHRHCRAVTHFSTAQARVWCDCGWVRSLTAQQIADITGALLGTNKIPLPVYLMNLHVVEGGPAPPPPCVWSRDIHIRRALAALPLPGEEVAA